jgi:hypothetical protein
MVGPAEGHLPDGTGFNPYGIWLQEIDYKALGYPPPPESKRATTWGPVRIGSEEERNLVSFLKSFRYIVETAESLDQMLSEMKELSTSTPGNRSTISSRSKHCTCTTTSIPRNSNSSSRSSSTN